MNIAVLGGAGFIGTNLVEFLLESEETDIFVFDNFSMGNQLKQISEKGVHVTEGQMESTSQLGNFLEMVRPTRIYHFVANSDIASASNNPNLDIKNTYATTVNLIQCIKELRIEEVVFASSSAVYGECAGSISEDAPFNPVSSYGWMKTASEIALDYAQKSGVINKLLITRFPNVTGNYQTHGVIFDLVTKLYSPRNSLEVLGNGFQNKPYLSARKLVETIEQIRVHNQDKNLTVNISPKDRVNVRDIVDLIYKYTGSLKPVEYQKSSIGWKGDIPSYELDTSLLRKIVPDIQLPTSAESVMEGIKYMCELYDK